MGVRDWFKNYETNEDKKITQNKNDGIGELKKRKKIYQFAGAWGRALEVV